MFMYYVAPFNHNYRHSIKKQPASNHAHSKTLTTMRILASFVFFSLFGDLRAAPTWTTTTTSSIHARHARLSPTRRNVLNLSSRNGDPRDLNRSRSDIVAPNAKREDTPISLPEDLYGGFFDDLESWGHKESKEEKPVPPVQEVLLQDVTTSSSAGESPTPTTFTRPDHLPHMGPGLELAPSASPSTKSIRASSSSLRKLIVVATVFGVIGLVILCCFLVNEPRILLWLCCKARKTSPSEPVRIKRKLVMTEKDRSAWTSKCLLPLSPRPKYLSPPSSSPNDTSELSASSNGQRSSSLVQHGGLDISSDLQKSKWSITTSDYGISPRTSASTTGGQRSIAPDSAQLVPPPALVSSPRVYNPLASGSERNSDGSLCRYGHSRNQSAPVTPSIASSGSDWNVEGRSRSSSESSWKVPTVQWR